MPRYDSPLTQRRRLAGLPLISLLLLWSTPVRAHLRWFVDSTEGFTDQSYALDTTSIVLLICTAVFCGAVVWAHHQSRRWRPKSALGAGNKAPETIEWRLIAVLAAFMLFDNVRTGVFLAPNLVLPGPGIQLFGAIAQAALGLLLAFQVSFVISGILVVVALLLASLYFPAALTLDYFFEFSFFAAALILVGPRLSGLDRRLFRLCEFNPQWGERLPLPLIRIGVGLTLVILAVHNKLISPALPLAFLAEHQYNFMPALGFSGFTDLHFSLAAGLGELALGLFLLFGISTRFVVAVLTVFFVFTLISLGPLEVTGHFVIFGIAILLLVRGGGRLSLQPRTSTVPPGVSCTSAAPEGSV